MGASQLLPYVNLVLSISAILLNIEKILSRFKPKSLEKSKHTSINVTNGNLYQTGPNSKLEVNLDKAKKSLENKDYESSIRFLYSAIKINMELDTEINVKIWKNMEKLEQMIIEKKTA